MNTFGQRLAERRKARGLTQSEFARRLDTNHSMIGKYERNQVRPSIDVLVRLASELDTTSSYLLGELDDGTLLENREMLDRIRTIHNLPEEQRRLVFLLLDALLRDFKARELYDETK